MAKPCATCPSKSSLIKLDYSLGFLYSCFMLQIRRPGHVMFRVRNAVRDPQLGLGLSCIWQRSHCTCFLLQGYGLVVELCSFTVDFQMGFKT